ncbi:MAG: hypothetical protein AB7R63_07305 [Phycisphaerales bacterium]
MEQIKRGSERRVLAGVAALLCGLTAGAWQPVVAQSGGQQAPLSNATNEQLLTDFIHYVKIDQKELAAANARALLDRGLSAEQFLGLVEDSPQASQRFDEAIRQALRDPALEGLAAELFGRFRQGQLDRARNPEEISKSIALLDDTQRARMLARQRLAAAGEFATPQLLEALSRGEAYLVQRASEDLLVDMGGDVVAPLCTALLAVEPTLQERLCRTLGRIGRGTALPYLAEVRESTKSDAVRSAATEAIARVGGIPDGMSVSDLYVSLAERYAGEAPELTRFPGESHQLVWTYESGVGLYATPVRSEVYHEAMAMRLCEHALRLNGDVNGAAGLWIASNISRELDQPADYENPVYPATRRDAMYYAVASGASVMDGVLGRALGNRHTALARVAIKALTQTAGGRSMESAASEGSALATALTYPDRRVQVEAALALAGSAPAVEFAGSDRVTPILGAAIRDAGSRFALVVSPDPERRQILQRIVESAGYKALAPAATLDDAAGSIADAAGVDLIVSDGSGSATEALIANARSSAKIGATPILALLPHASYNDLLNKYEREPLTRLMREGVTPDQVTAAAQTLVERAAGPAWSDDQALSYSLKAVRALRDMAIEGSRVFRVEDAMRPLQVALTQQSGRVRLEVADVLARIADPSAQQSVMDAALSASGDDRLLLLERVGQSARRFGNMLDERQVRRLVELTRSTDDAEATGAAALMGSLDLPGGQLAPLILGE